MTESNTRSLSDVRKELGRGFVWYFSTTFLGQVISWGLTLYTARLLSPRDYGLLALTDTIIPYLLILSTLKLETWFVQKPNLTLAEEEIAQSLLIILGLVFAAITYNAAPFVAAFYREPAIADPMRCFALIFPLRALQLAPEGRMRRLLRFKELGLANFSIGLIRGVTQVVLVLLGLQYWALVIGAVGSEILRSVYFAKLAGMPRRLSLTKKTLREIFYFGFSAAGATIGWIVYSTSDNVVVGRLFGVEMLGFYAMAYYLMDLPLSKINTIISPLILPYFVQLREHPHALKKTFFRSTSSLVGIVAPVLSGAFAVAPLALPLLLGEKWTPLVLPFQALALVGILRSIPVHTINLLYCLNRPNDIFRSSLLPAIILPPSFIILGWLLKTWHGDSAGMLGIYFTWLVLFPIVGVDFAINVACKAGGYQRLQFYKALLPAFVGSIGIVATVMIVDYLAIALNPSLRLTIECLCGIIAYPLILWVAFRRRLLENIVLLRRLRRK